MYAGLVSSHFFFRLLQVIQPVLERALVALTGTGSGCLRGRPRFRGTLAGTPVASLSFPTSDGLMRCNSSVSSSSSILGTTLSLEKSSWGVVMVLYSNVVGEFGDTSDESAKGFW